MMRVKMLTAICGHKYDGKIAPGLPHGRFVGVFSYAPGQIAEFPRDEAMRFIERGMAAIPDTKDSK